VIDNSLLCYSARLTAWVSYFTWFACDVCEQVTFRA
jgi:hypothetical protein